MRGFGRVTPASRFRKCPMPPVEQHLRAPREARERRGEGVMLKVIARLLPLLLLFHFHPDSVDAQQLDRPPSLNLGDAVVTGFSGTLAPDPTKPHPASKSAVDLTFINPDGPAARIIGLGQPGYVWDGRLVSGSQDVRCVGERCRSSLRHRARRSNPTQHLSRRHLRLRPADRQPRRDGLPERRKDGGPAPAG